MFTKLRAIVVGALAIASVAIAAPALAQSAMELKSDVKVEKTVTDESGATTTQLVAPDIVVPGDKVVFSTLYKNNGTQAAENVVINNPLHSAVRFAEDADPELSVSVDGGENWGKLAELSVTNDDGSVRAAEASDVTHVRWILEVVQPGESGSVKYHAIIR